MINKISLFLYIMIIINLQSCNGCSNSGRSQIIEMAKRESQKPATIPKPITLIKESEPEIVEFEEIVTPIEKKSIEKELVQNKIPPSEGKLIQVEGLVLKEAMMLTINLNTSESSINQILAMKNHIRSNWHYVNDPVRGSDTWRSAEATLSLKYKGKYSGDCDDYAILLASLARQIGLISRMVGGFNEGEGHAFAEFLLLPDTLSPMELQRLDYRIDSSGTWISLDWFQGREHNKYTKDIIIFNDI